MNFRSGVAYAIALLSALLGMGSPGAAADTAPAVTFDLQGHRGARGLAPENSLPGFEKALALGVTTLEMDVVMTADDVLVAYHDRRIVPDRTRGLDGRWLTDEGPLVRDLTVGQLSGFDIGRLKPGSRSRERFPGQRGLDGVRIPTVQAVIELAERRSSGRIRYNIELKRSPLEPAATPPPDQMVSALLKLIRIRRTGPRTSIQSFDWGLLDLVAAQAPDISRVYLTAEQEWLDNLGRGSQGARHWLGDNPPDWARVSVPEAIARRGGTVWSPYHRDLTDQDLAQARALGLKVIVWTVNDPAAMRDLIARGVDGIITDYPDRLRQVMGSAGLPLPRPFPAQALP